jgi:hypothetical protein
MEGQTHFGMPRGAKMSLALHELIYKPPHLPPRMHQKLTRHGRFCKQNNQLPTKSHDELEDKSNIEKSIET